MAFTAPGITFEIVLNNPCLDATIGAAIFSPSEITATYGTTTTSEYTIPDDSVDLATGKNRGAYCGARTYLVTDDSDNSSTAWAEIESSTVTNLVTLTIDTTQYEPAVLKDNVSVTLRITTTLSAWPANSGRVDRIKVNINRVYRTPKLVPAPP